MTSGGDGYNSTALGTAQGGNGGSVSFGNGGRGSGGMATSISTATAANNSSVYASDRATGGSGYSANSGIRDGGNGGSASSTATAHKFGIGDQAVSAYANATGRVGGNGSGIGKISGNGGNAVAIATATNNGGSSDASAIANAGQGGPGRNGAQSGIDGSAVARSSASGVSGSSTSQANSTGNLVTNLRSSATGSVGGGMTITEARTSIAGSMTSPALADGLHSAAFGIGLPGDEDVNTAMAGNQNVISNFDVSGNSDILGAVLLGGGYSNDAIGTQIYSSYVDFDLNMSQLTDPQNLLVGFLDPTITGNGFDTLNFRIFQEGVSVVDELFTDSTSAFHYFNNQTLDLGDWTQMLDGNLDLMFQLDLTTSSTGDSFNTDFIFGNSTVVPIPSAVWLFGSGLIGLVGFARRKKA